MVITSDTKSSSNGANDSKMAGKVFAIPELLENTLLMLDDRHPDDNENFSSAIVDLFVLQRVNKTFKATIDGSIKLQRIMLLKHDSEDAAERPFGLQYLVLGPLGYDSFHPALACDNVVKEPDGGRVSRLYWSNYDFYADDQEKRDGYMRCNCYRGGSGGQELRDSIEALNRAASKHYFCPGASWRRLKMFSRPQEVKLQLLAAKRKGNSTKAGSYTYTAKLSPIETLGAVYDTVQQVVFRSKKELDHMQDDLECIARELVDARDRTTEKRGIQSLEKLRVRKCEHEKRTNCGSSRGLCNWCSAIQLLPAFGDIARDLDTSQ